MQADYRKLIGAAYHRAAVQGRRRSNAARLVAKGANLGHDYVVFTAKFGKGIARSSMTYCKKCASAVSVKGCRPRGLCRGFPRSKLSPGLRWWKFHGKLNGMKMLMKHTNTSREKAKDIADHLPVGALRNDALEFAMTAAAEE